MTAQAWLETARKIIADCDRSKLSFQIVCNAAAIIRSQQERIERLTAELKERETEVEKLTHERDLWENMAAMRLADQERIERHTEKRVAGEILDIVGHCESFADLRSVIWQKYGVE